MNTSATRHLCGKQGTVAALSADLDSLVRNGCVDLLVVILDLYSWLEVSRQQEHLLKDGCRRL